MSQIIPTAEPFFFPGTLDGPSQSAGCLLVHGFTGTPKEMRQLGAALNKQGFSVLGVRLAGHATRPQDMLRSNYTDWLASVEDGFQLLSGTARHIYLMGLSMGGALVLTSAASLPVRGVLAMSTPCKVLEQRQLKYVELLARFRAYTPKSKEAPGSSWFDQHAWQEHVSYPQYPLRSIGQLDRLLALMRATLPTIKVPVLLIHSRDDKTVLPDNMSAIYNGLGCSDKSMLWINGSGHVITRDAQREHVFNAAIDFVRRIEAT